MKIELQRYSFFNEIHIHKIVPLFFSCLLFVKCFVTLHSVNELTY